MPATRPLPQLPEPGNPLDALSPQQLADEDQDDDPTSLELRVQDLEPEPEITDAQRDRLLHNDTRWSLDLDNPYGWTEPAPLIDRTG